MLLKYLYYITHTDNLSSILEKVVLLTYYFSCRDEVPDIETCFYGNLEVY
jgi:hypothetical protein